MNGFSDMRQIKGEPDHETLGQGDGHGLPEPRHLAMSELVTHLRLSLGDLRRGTDRGRRKALGGTAHVRQDQGHRRPDQDSPCREVSHRPFPRVPVEPAGFDSRHRSNATGLPSARGNESAHLDGGTRGRAMGPGRGSGGTVARLVRTGDARAGGSAHGRGRRHAQREGREAARGSGRCWLRRVAASAGWNGCSGSRSSWGRRRAGSRSRRSTGSRRDGRSPAASAGRARVRRGRRAVAP